MNPPNRSPEQLRGRHRSPPAGPPPPRPSAGYASRPSLLASRSVFTLIELLVVIAIIAVLGATHPLAQQSRHYLAARTQHPA
ncbi:MAG TPA: prepilin-type N-terminal cleavage/methylation domain-containing protein [Verrucomicrobiota bacterium]|nr:prepilin-type N-terminal cleavage/methylation domain-containing protein [Verrucomicrobiota bacterium]